MNNLLSGTGIGTVFVDLQLHFEFTPAASSIINLIVSDVGRPGRTSVQLGGLHQPGG
ncbi:MAG: PAS domain-containing protein [Rhodoferax sp.]|nr:PAS domain-containing protein [Rhodoferax sp.]